MPLDNNSVRQLIAELASPLPKQRESAADSIIDWMSGIDQTVASPLSRALESVIILESDDDALEAQMHALVELASASLVPRDVVSRVVAARAWGRPWAEDYVEGLQEALAISPT